MLGTTLKSAWPTTLNCLSWSDDSELAIGLGEYVALLTPNVTPRHLRTDRISQQSRENTWDEVRLRVNIFTAAESPLQNPARSEIFSIGEEQAIFTVAALSWSPPGLAKHGRCALAILTTNHVLSIWEPARNPREAGSWKRVLVVNHALKRYFEEEVEPEEPMSEFGRQERLRMRMRIRAFAWAPGSGEATRSGPPRSGISLKRDHFLAIGNDEGEIVIIRICSPYDILSTEKLSWRAEVIHQFSGPTLSPATIEAIEHLPSSLLSDYLAASQIVTHVAWSPWCDSKSYIAYLVKPTLKVRLVNSEFQSPDSSIRSSGQEVTIPGEHVAPLTWVIDQERQMLLLLSFSGDVLICTTISLEIMEEVYDAQTLEITRQNLGRRWDEVSGVALTNEPTPGSPHFHYSLHLHHHEIRPISVPFSSHTLPGIASWQQQIEHCQTAFGAEHDLAGNVLTRVWGLAASPFGDFVAACITLHPSDMIQYSIPADQETVIVIGREGTRKRSLAHASGDVAMQSILFDICSSLGRDNAMVAESYRTREDAADLYETFYQAVTAEEQDSSQPEQAGIDVPDDVMQGLHLDTSSLCAIIQRIKRSVLADQNLMRRRFSRLLAPAHQLPILVDDLDANLLSTVCSVFEFISRYCPPTSRLDRLIICIYASVMRKFDHRSHLPKTVDGAESPPSILEQCEICGKKIAFESLRWARCITGHSFVRCALTFLAIQAPGISKFCSICGKQYLSDEYVLAQENDITSIASENGERVGGLTDEIEADVTMREADQYEHTPLRQGACSVSLARILFSACEVCIHCGGKFVG